MPLPDVDDESLAVWLFGPGIGELVVVRAPSNRWLVVDGCATRGEGYAQKLLTHYGARPSLVAMTHPHKDHARGLREVIELATSGPVEHWPRLGMVPAPQTDGAGDTWDAFASLAGGEAEQVVATILSRWQRHAASRWELTLGSQERLGDATLRVLSPTVAERDTAARAWETEAAHDYNRAATAFLLTWQGRRVLLGSDLVEAPGLGWTSTLGLDPAVPAHDVYKVAHHGSAGAIGPQVQAPATAMTRLWIATPFASQGLPRSGDGEGLERLLNIEDEIVLTGLPCRYAEQAATARDLTRAVLRDDEASQLTGVPQGFPDCWIHVNVPRLGPAVVTRGAGAVTVRE